MKTVLVANRGEIAVRVIDAVHEMGMRAVAVYSDADRDALHVTRADVAVALDGAAASETYLNVEKILDAARRTGADAVHPGYGFLSENAGFARAVTAAGLTWVGPHAEAIARMGDKLAAKRLAAELGLPLLPSAELEGDAPFEWHAQAAAVGYPLLVKAAAGGGGRGMRLVLTEEDLDEAVPSARREAQESFGDGTVFAEHWLASPRHIEIQVVADKHGHVLHLGERECSIQRRHQKLIEEAPSPAVDEFLRDQMGAAAIRLAEAIDYDSVGTVEFLLDADHGTFSFLEMNTRLQVEHRVTEEVTGFDLVELQFRAAAGEEFDFEQVEIDIEGHAIEARLVAEDPANDWLPSTGVLHRYRSPSDPYVRCDCGLRPGMEITSHYDSLLAKLIASGESRDQAIGRLSRHLDGLQVHGVKTNRNHLVAVLESDDFRDGATTTAFVDLHLTLLDARAGDATTAVHLLAAALWGQHVRRDGDPHWAPAPSGWRNVGEAAQHVAFEADGDRHQVSYRMSTGGSFTATVDGAAFTGRLLDVAGDRSDRDLLLELNGVAVTCSVHHVGDTWYVNSAEGQSDLVELPRFPESSAALAAGGSAAPVPGRVISVEVSIGDVVAAGQTLVVMEAMKVEHRVTAPAEGKVVEVLVAPGDNVDAHQVLVHMESVT